MNNEAYRVLPYSSSTIAIDGVATQKEVYKVFKVTTGISVVINQNGDIELNYENASWLQILAAQFLSGWINELPDKTWVKLFDAAKYYVHEI